MATSSNPYRGFRLPAEVTEHAMCRTTSHGDENSRCSDSNQRIMLSAFFPPKVGKPSIPHQQTSPGLSVVGVTVSFCSAVDTSG